MTETLADLGAALVTARAGSGKTQLAAAAAVGMSQGKLSKIESGALPPTDADLAALARLYALPTQERDRLAAIATRERRNRSERARILREPAAQQRRIGELERASTTICGFQSTVVHGLLQTEGYARLIFAALDQAEEAVAARMERQRLLEEAGRWFVLLLTEGALRWHAGSPELMVEQLEALDFASRRPTVRLGIIPWTQPVTVFPPHGFDLYDDVVAVETATALLTTSTPDDAEHYTELHARLEALAVFGDAAREELARIADDYRRMLPRRRRSR